MLMKRRREQTRELDLTAELRKEVRGEVRDDADTLRTYSRDASLFEVRPRVVVSPADTADLSALVAFASKHAGDVSLTPRSGGTDMTGGPLSSSIVVDMTAHLNHLKKVGDGWAMVEPGMYYRYFEVETLKRKLLLPTYPASRGICTVGGMVGNNAGGEKSLTYGQTGNFVSALRVVLSDAKEYLVQPLDREALSQKESLKGLEGKIYRDIRALCERSADVLRKAKPTVTKNSAGYDLWRVWDGTTFDLTKLLVGSQGTLGIITEIRFRLIPVKEHARQLVISLFDIRALTAVVSAVLRHHPESFEVYDDVTYRLARRCNGILAKQLGIHGRASAWWLFRRELLTYLSRRVPRLTFLVEFTGDDTHALDSAVAAAHAELRTLPVSLRDVQKEGDMRKERLIRRESYNLLRQQVPGKRAAPFIDDITVAADRLATFLPQLETILTPYHLSYTLAGHAGDGNFHIIPLMDLGDERQRQALPEITDRVYDLVFRFNGSMTGEHNDGLLRSPYLKEMYGKDVYALFEEVKKIFDPKGIFNPGKKVGASAAYAWKHVWA
jgi:FAD/FMN-containing dehydrogenase